MPEAALRSTAGVLDGVPLVGTGPIADRLYTRPAVTVVGLDATPVASAPNAVVPVARAKVSVRLAPGEDPDHAYELVSAHLRAAAPWGIEVQVSPGAGAPGWLLEDGGPALAAARGALADAYGKEAVTVGTGGAIPLVTVLADLLPEADIVLWGAQDDGARIHAGDESVDLAELQRATTAEALLLARLGAAAGGPARASSGRDQVPGPAELGLQRALRRVGGSMSTTAGAVGSGRRGDLVRAGWSAAPLLAERPTSARRRSGGRGRVEQMPSKMSVGVSPRTSFTFPTRWPSAL
jgi:hypothetical protein